MVAPVRGARLVLADTDGVRANMTASWLAQMAWDVYVLDGVESKDFNIAGAWQAELPFVPEAPSVDCSTLETWLQAPASHEETIVIDLARHAQYVQGHIPAARYVLRSQFDQAMTRLPTASRYVLTCPDGVMARFAFDACAQALRDRGHTAAVYVLAGGTQAWRDAGLDLEKGPTHLISPPIDRYKRPYEGTNNAREAMQGYLDWEFGLVEQLGRDGTHHFWVL
jgi:rhodanese-related sulfurtransferase